MKIEVDGREKWRDGKVVLIVVRGQKREGIMERGGRGGN